MPSILIAEADGMIAKYFKAVIEGLGYSVCGIARTTEEAALLAQEEQPDLVLLDDHLPGAGDGADLVRKVAGSRTASIVIVTAVEDPAMLARIRAACPSAEILTKPVRARELSSTLYTCLH